MEAASLSSDERRLREVRVALHLAERNAFADFPGEATGRSMSAFLSERLRSPPLASVEHSAALSECFARFSSLSAAQRRTAVLAAQACVDTVLAQSGGWEQLARRHVAEADAKGVPVSLSSLLIEPGWRAALAPVLATPEARALESFLAQERAAGAVFPPLHLTFAALNATPLPAVRVLLLGQDPYHQPGNARGLAFAVPRGMALPSSLRNVLKELEADVGVAASSEGDLAGWASQGVLLLNTVLSVRSGAPNSHAAQGWEAVTDAAVRAAAAAATGRGGLVALLWGAKAAAKAALLPAGEGHAVLRAAHPSGLSASRGFFGSRPFSAANAALAARGLAPIDWARRTQP